MLLKSFAAITILLSFMLLENTAWSNSEQNNSAPQNKDIFQMDIEDLMNVEVVSASKRPQRLTEVPAAVFVITGEDIRRSGATSIPEALLMAFGSVE